MMDLTELAGRINATSIHAMGITGRGIKVAMLDSGIQSDHPFIGGSIIKQQNLTTDGIDDEFGHGTHLSGILLATAPNVDIINIKILDDNGNTTLSTIAKGIDTAINLGADIINVSAGAPTSGCPDNKPLAKLVNSITLQGIPVVCAAGNDGRPNLPASSPGAIAVGALGNKGKTAKYSSRGMACNEKFPDCVAYGSDIISSVPINDYQPLKGTSLAAPQVSGMLALLMEGLKTNFTRDEIEIILSQSCKRIESFDKNNSSGWGLIDCAKAYRSAQVLLGLL